MAENAVQFDEAQKASIGILTGDDVPEGVFLSPAWKRTAAYLLDWIAIMGILHLLTKGTFVLWLFSISELTNRPHLVLLHWLILFGFHFLYFKYTGRWMGRSLGQRWFGIALVHDDATPLGEAHWGRRSARKLIYALPVVGLLFFGVRDFIRIKKDQKHQSSIDVSEHTVAAVYWSLPATTRAMLR